MDWTGLACVGLGQDFQRTLWNGVDVSCGHSAGTGLGQKKWANVRVWAGHFCLKRAE